VRIFGYLQQIVQLARMTTDFSIRPSLALQIGLDIVRISSMAMVPEPLASLFPMS
jgi:hypothetical protein